LDDDEGVAFGGSGLVDFLVEWVLFGETSFSSFRGKDCTFPEKEKSFGTAIKSGRVN
jgi:hypothetical protein